MAVAQHHTAPAEGTQEEIEGETAGAIFAPLDLLKFHPGIAKVLCRISATGSLEVPDYNVASVTDNGTGDWTVVYDDDFSTVNYSVSPALAVFTTDPTTMTNELAVGSDRIRVRGSGGPTDKSITFVAFGDQ